MKKLNLYGNLKKAKHVRQVDFKKVDNCDLQWFKQVRNINIRVNPTLFRQKVEEFVKKLNVTKFKC